ncbi:unnamed protein product [Prunus brigantina]
MGLSKICFGYYNEVCTLINNLGRGVAVDRKCFYFATLSERHNSYCRKPWNKWKANLRQNYINQCFQRRGTRKFLPVQKFPDLAHLAPPRSAWTCLATPPLAFPVLNVQLAKQPTASNVFLPPCADGREGVPLKTLISIHLGQLFLSLQLFCS